MPMPLAGRAFHPLCQLGAPAQGVPHDPDVVGRAGREQHRAFPAGDHPVQAHQRDQDLQPEAHRDLPADQPPVHLERGDQRRQPQHEGDVGDVRPGDVGERHLRARPVGGGHAHRQLWRRRAEGHDGQAHDQRGHPEGQGQLAAAAHDEVRARDEHHQTDRKGDQEQAGPPTRWIAFFKRLLRVTTCAVSMACGAPYLGSRQPHTRYHAQLQEV